MGGEAAEWGPEAIATYLYYGYLPEVPRDLSAMPGWGVPATSNGDVGSHDEVVERGIAAFSAAFDELPDGPHVVPLSGGLDSRAILAELVHRVSPSDITAVTIGSPGSLDYALAVNVAAAVGVRHVRIDLARYKLSEEALLSTAAKNDAPTWVFDATYNRLMRDRLESDAIYWSGYLGSRLSSTKHLASDPNIGFHEAIDRFVGVNRWSRSVRLHPPDADLTRGLPPAPMAPGSALGQDEQLDLWIRQERLTRPVNLPAGFRNRAPFAHAQVAEFLLSLPRANGYRQQVYRDVLLRAYPHLFSLPTTANAGLALEPSAVSRLGWYGRRVRNAARRRLLASRPDVWQANYLDMAHAVRHREDYRRLVRSRLQSLVDKGATPWLDIEQLWNEHQRHDADHTLALTLLVSLDIHLDVAGKGR